MNALGVLLRRHSGSIGDVNLDVQRMHDVHSNEYRGRFEANDHYEASFSSGFAPL